MSTDRSTLDALAAVIRQSQRFVITSHARPDGDAIGSALGLMHILESMGKRADVVFHDPVPHIYRSLPGADRIVRALPTTPPDAAVLLECDCIERSGYVPAEFAAMNAQHTLNIDHHQSGKHFADVNWIDPDASAVGAMLYTLAESMSATISPAAATCLYAAVLTDTGSFTYASTTASTFALASHLVERGAEPNHIAQAVYFSNPASKFHLLGEALRHLHVSDGVAWAWVMQDDITRARAEVEDCEGVVNYLIGIAGVQAAVFLREVIGGGAFRLSLRSKGELDVAAIAEQFNGGGHRRASGCTVDGSLDQALERILPHLYASAANVRETATLLA